MCDGLTTTCPPDGFAAPGVPCTSDQNVCTLDQCDGSGNCTHPAGNAGTVCRPATDQCDLAETCTGASVECPADQCQPNGTSCDDGDACTTGETCQECACGGVTPTVCGPCETCVATGGCVVAPRDGCKRVTPMTIRTFKSQLKLKDMIVDTFDSLDWRWKKGDRTTLAELGDPTTETGYTFCIFDESGAEPKASMSAKVAPDGTCSGKPCWKLLGSLGFHGYRFRDSSGAQDGITKIWVKPGEEGRPKAQVLGRGLYLDMPTLPLSLPVSVQLQTEGAACWEATCESDGVSRNDASQFSAHCE